MATAHIATYDHYDPVSLGPAIAGWRAVYPNPEGPNPHWLIRPLLCWGVFHHTKRQYGSDQVVEDRGNDIVGVVSTYGAVTNIQGFHTVFEEPGFQYYLPPGAPEPTP